MHAIFGDNPGKRIDILIVKDRISRIERPGSIASDGCLIIDGTNLYLFPGVIDSQVHFREPGLTHKATIYTESRAAVAGGVTSFMEMPNTNPPATTTELLEEKYGIASKTSLANYSFFMGTTNNNFEEIMKINPKNVCGVKIFMGSSTGDMLVDSIPAIERVFANIQNCPISVHCENDLMIKDNLYAHTATYGEENITAKYHPLIRDAEACYTSSKLAVELAKKHGNRLHILHISTAKEVSLFQNNIPLKDKRITAEACVHHLTFSDADYEKLGNFIKWNPAIKTADDRFAIWNAILNDSIDVICTDHAPHTLEEKKQAYLKAPSGGPLVQHGLMAMLQHNIKPEVSMISLQKIVQKMCNNQAILFNIKDRGFIREGYFADLVLVDMNSKYTVTKDNILYKCGWSPFEGKTFNSAITHTFVNGHLAYEKGTFDDTKLGERLVFDR